MPYKSKAQARKFHADPKLKGMAPHWDEETKKKKGGFKALPAKAKKAKSPSKPKKGNKKKKSKKS